MKSERAERVSHRVLIRMTPLPQRTLGRIEDFVGLSEQLSCQHCLWMLLLPLFGSYSLRLMMRVRSRR